MKIYEVGGAVRDRLLNKPVQDRDWVVVGATSEELISQGYLQVGKSFPVFLHPDTKEEYALARTERKTGPGYTGFSFHASPDVSLEDDLGRRDLTINAMALDADGKLMDPFGGREDLENGILRHVSPAFVEDPVRVLRVARFTARFGFRMADETLELMRVMVANGEIDSLVPERVWAELRKALAEPRPTAFFDALDACGARRKLFPEIHRLYGVPQPKNHHPEVDTGVHVMLVLEQAAGLTPDTQVRFAALTHDLGKGDTPEDEWPHHHGHEERSVGLIRGLCRRYRIPNEYRDLAMLTARYHSHCHRAGELRAATILKTLKALDAFRRPQRFAKFLLACAADYRGRGGYTDRPYPQAEALRRALRAAAAVDGRELAARGLSNQAIGRELHRRRLRAIREMPPLPGEP